MNGHSLNNIGVYGNSNEYWGIYGKSITAAGVVGNGDPGVWAQGKLKVDDVPEAPNEERFLVWDADNIIKYRSLPTGGTGSECTQCNEGNFSIFGITIIDPPSGGSQPAVQVKGNGIQGAPALAVEGGESILSDDGAKPSLVISANNPNDPTQFAMVALGNVSVSGDVIAANIGAATIVSKIDHPEDPANKYLNHSFVESSERMNVYNGNIQLDAIGEAWVELPQWFEALNKDFRYQLTCIGGFAQVYIAQEVQNNRFKIAGGTSGLKISWQVTGVRQDAFAKTHPLRVEEQKRPEEVGKYLQPEAFGLSSDNGIFYSKQPELKNIVEKYKNKEFKTAK